MEEPINLGLRPKAKNRLRVKGFFVEAKRRFTRLKRAVRVFLATLSVAVLVLGIFVATRETQKDQSPRTDAAEEGYPSRPKALDTGYFLGVYYMPKPANITHQWHDLKLFNRQSGIQGTAAVRYPLLGYYSGEDIEAVDWQIKWAVESGIRYFIFDEFWTMSQNTPVFNTSMSSFLSARYKNAIRFAVMLSQLNVPGQTAEAKRQKLLEDVAPYFAEAHKSQPNYLTIGGKPVIFVRNPAVIFGERAGDVAWGKAVLDDFEAKIGTEAIWLISQSTRIVDNSQKQGYLGRLKDMGFTGLAPYYIFPGISKEGDADDTSDVNSPPDLTLAYSDFAADSARSHEQLFKNTISNGLKFVPSLINNFDESPRYLIKNQRQRRPATDGQSLELYRNLLAGVKSQVDNWNASTRAGAPPLLKVGGRPMINLGAWNEWTEDSHVEPGLGSLSANNPFALLDTIAEVFAGSAPAGRERPAGVFTPVTEPQSLWVMGNREDAKKWMIPPNATEIEPVVEGKWGRSTVDKGRLILEVSPNIDVSSYKGVRITIKASCADSDPCTGRMRATWFTTTYPTNLDVAGAEVSGENRSGKVAFQGISNCSRSTDLKWLSCDFIPKSQDVSWSGTLERLTIDIFPELSTINKAPVIYGLGRFVLIPKERSLPVEILDGEPVPVPAN